jgi:hypothetical protein
MEHRLELAAKALAIERLATGGLAAIVPARAIGAIVMPGSDAEAERYLARLLEICQVVCLPFSFEQRWRWVTRH